MYWMQSHQDNKNMNETGLPRGGQIKEIELYTQPTIMCANQ